MSRASDRALARCPALVRRALQAACAALATLGCSAVAGANRAPLPDFDARASPAARELVARALDGLVAPEAGGGTTGDGGGLIDMHAHVAGTADDDSGAEVSPDMRSWLHPWRRIQFSVYLSASGVDDVDRGAQQMVERLAAVAVGKVCALALDRRHHADGRPDADGTALYVPNDHVLRLAAERPGLFVAVVSVHPYRVDALAELDRCAAAGARIVKWLPNAMGVDPASPACDAFYARMRAHGMTLLSHAGEEAALAAGDEAFGNPLRLRRPLDHGVRVIVAHCASLGTAEDLDDPRRAHVESFALFLRMMGEQRYRELLYGDLSAIAFHNRDVEVVRTLLERTDLHARLLDGTDWPLPAIRMMTPTRRFVKAGLLTRAESDALEEVFRYNPRLFDLALKRTLRGRGGERFPPAVFLQRREILP